MFPPLSDTQAECRRQESRTNLFVAATIATPRLQANVRLRNISPSGALIEGSELPEVGEDLCLRRGSLSAVGTVMRRDEKYAGLHFDAPIDPAEWLPSNHHGQQRVDRIVHEVRDLFPNAQPSAAFLASQQRSGPDCAELRDLADLLDTLADTLASDADVVARYLGKLHVLDMAAQKLRLLAQEG
ncbi:PilZ domain-containing protein [Qipengyuania sp. MTN3-11]|uniref:PilZ domain-containing protein n=1 Tax=Qipengyuania sp. MTN3-11 TaxID=3056557 RepID=UPI0036F33041